VEEATVEKGIWDIVVLAVVYADLLYAGSIKSRIEEGNGIKINRTRGKGSSQKRKDRARSSSDSQLGLGGGGGTVRPFQ